MPPPVCNAELVPVSFDKGLLGELELKFDIEATCPAAETVAADTVAAESSPWNWGPKYGVYVGPVVSVPTGEGYASGGQVPVGSVLHHGVVAAADQEYGGYTAAVFGYGIVASIRAAPAAAAMVSVVFESFLGTFSSVDVVMRLSEANRLYCSISLPRGL